MKLFFPLTLLFINFAIAQRNSNVVWLTNEFNNELISPSNCIIDNIGFVWIATQNNLYFYNGLDVKKFENMSSPDLDGKRIVHLSKSDNGVVYFSTVSDDYVYNIYDGNVSRIMLNNYHIHLNQDKHISEIKFSNREFYNEFFKKKVFSVKRNVFHLYTSFTIDGFHYFFSSFDFTVFDSLGQMVFKKEYARHSEYIPLKLEDKLFLLKEGMLFTVNHDFSIDKNFIYYNSILDIKNLFFDSNGNIYLYDKGKVFKLLYSNNQIEFMFLFDCYDCNISSIEYDFINKCYFITSPNKGFGVVKEYFFHKISQSSSNPDYAVIQLNDESYFSTTGWFHNNTSCITYSSDSFSGINPYFILPYENKFYVNLDNSLINIFDSSKLVTNGTHKINHLQGFCYFQDTLWLVKSHDKGVLLKFRDNELQKDSFISKFLFDQEIISINHYNDYLILGTSTNLFIYWPKQNRILKVQQLEDVFVRNILHDHLDGFWICTYNKGLYYLKGTKAFKMSLNNINTSAIHSVVKVDNDVWLSTNNGLYTADYGTLKDCLMNNKVISFYKFSTFDGLPTNEFNGGSTHTYIYDKAYNILGYPTMKGFVYFYLNDVLKNRFNGPIIFNTVNTDFGSYVYEEDMYKVSSDANYIFFKVDFPYFGDRDNLKLTYALNDGIEYTIADNEFYIHRTNKDLEVTVIIRTQGFNDFITQKFKVTFTPRFYETIYFKGFILILVIVLIYISFHFGRNINRRNELNLLLKIRNKTNELRKAVYDLKLANNKLAKALKTNKLLQSEIHHRVKNHLQFLISILRVQSNAKDLNIDEFVVQSNARLVAISSIHDQLYITNSKEKVSLNFYLTKLSADLMKIRNVPYMFNLQSDPDEVYISQDLAVNIGLIINELISNSYKYAFSNVKDNFIHIKLEKDTNFLTISYSDSGAHEYSSNIDKSGLNIVDVLLMQQNAEVSRNGTFNNLIIRFPL